MAAVLRPTTLRHTPLVDVAALIDAPLVGAARSIQVSGVTLSSSDVRPGDLFAALPGAKTHGIRFAGPALDAGAAAILTDPEGAAACAGSSTPVLVVPDPRRALGPVCALVYGDPSRALSVLGVTGTNGKTTATYLIEEALGAAGLLAGLIGTIETRMHTTEGLIAVPAQRTTPEAPELQATLAVMAEHHVTAVAMEVSSHALALDRVAGTVFQVAAFTNFSQDHLDFHGDLESYFQSKARLFDGRAAHEVVMIDDAWGRRLVGGDTVTVSAAGNTEAHWHSGKVALAGNRTSFLAHGPGGRRVPVSLSLPGTFNVANAMVALAVLDCLGIDLDRAAKGLASARVPGRMEVVDAGQPFTALIDYAHTPAAVETLLGALTPKTDGSVILVLGCGGDRDEGKRPLMGEVAARGSDLLIITDDNPRSEEPALIRASMRAGAVGVPEAERGLVLEVEGRADAISAAVARAGPEDTVLIAGKGHEQGQEINGQILPFDDRAMLRAALADHGWTGGHGS